mgnify:CR=1 FL=1
MIVYALTDKPEDENEIKKTFNAEPLLDSHVSECHVISVVNGKHHMVQKLIECLKLAAEKTAVPYLLKISNLSEFFTETRIDSIWRRIGIGLSNFKLVLVRETRNLISDK